MCPAVAHQCHGSVLLFYEMHETLNIMTHFSTFTSLSINDLTLLLRHNGTATCCTCANKLYLR